MQPWVSELGQSGSERAGASQWRALPSRPAHTHVIQNVQEGFVVTQQEHTGGTAGGGWGGLRDN